MKVLLVVPPQQHYLGASACEALDRGREHRPNLGILYVASYLERNQPDITLQLLDCPCEDLNFDQYAARVKEFAPDVVGITTLTFTLIDALKAVEVTKKIQPRCKVCLGGFHCNLFPAETLRQSGVDFVVFGEGEETFSELIQALKKPGFTPEAIPGLAYYDDDKIVTNPSRPLNTDLDSLPFPNYHLLGEVKYEHVLGAGSRTIALQSSRGCPFGCAFCDIRRSPFRFRSADSVLAELSHWYDQGIRSFFFVDDNFVIKRKRLLSICEGIIANNWGIDFKISSRVDTVDKEMLLSLKRAGCNHINFGVESGDQRNLDFLQKGITSERTARTFADCKSIGVTSFAYMVIGLPDQTRDEMFAELRFLRAIKADYASFAVLVPYPKTHLYQMLLENGTILQDLWENFARNPDPSFSAPTVSKLYSGDDLRRIQSSLTRQFYLRPHFIWRKLVTIRNLGQMARQAKLGLRLILER